MPTAEDIIDLRRLLAERFPRAQTRLQNAPTRITLPTGVAALDEALGGGLPQGEVTELVGEGPGSGTAQVLHALIRTTAMAGQFLALIDGADSLDAECLGDESLARLLWVRCTSVDLALQSADLLLRDRNFPLVVLDLKLNPAVELRRIRANVWPRLDRLREHHGGTLLVLSSQAMVSGSTARVRVSGPLDLASTQVDSAEILNQLQFELERGGAALPSSPAIRVA